MSEVPDGEWFCPECEKEGQGGLEEPLRPSQAWMKAKKPGWEQRAQLAKAEMRPPISTKSSKRSLIDDERGSVVSNSASASQQQTSRLSLIRVGSSRSKKSKA